jgi:hypothetical protein
VREHLLLGLNGLLGLEHIAGKLVDNVAFKSVFNNRLHL